MASPSRTSPTAQADGGWVGASASGDKALAANAASTPSVSRLASELRLVGEEVQALISLLAGHGLLRPERFRADLHRRRFAASLREHPCRFEAGVVDAAASVAGLGEALRDQAGLSGLLAFRASCSSLCRSVPFAGLREVCPPRLYVFGGDSNGQSLSSAECFSFEPSPSASSSASAASAGIGSWEPLPPMRRGRSLASAAALGGCVYICGGRAGEQVLSSVERFRVADGSWTDVPPMLERREAPAAVAAGGCVLVVGGGDGTSVLRSAERLETDGDWGHWAALPPMACGRLGCGAAAIGEEIFALGGSAGGGAGALSSAERLRLVGRGADSHWEALPCMLQRRERFAAAAIDGFVFVCGGGDGLQVHGSAERFDPASNFWEALPPMPQRRQGVAAAAAAGQLLVLGGCSGRQDLRSAERFDPANGVWESLRPMLAPRNFACVAALRG